MTTVPSRILWPSVVARVLHAGLVTTGLLTTGLLATGLLTTGLLATELLAPAPAAAEVRVAPQDTIRDLADLFALGQLVADQNGDSLPDAVRARLVVGPDPDRAVTVAAANLAARLGFETTATDLGLAESGGAATAAGPVVLVGADALRASGLDVDALQSRLAPGQGSILVLPAGGTTPFGGVGLLGADATGLLAAAAYLSGRYPSVWGVDQTTWGSFTGDVRDWVTDASPTASLALTQIVVEAGRGGVVRAEATAAVATTAARDALLQALEGGPEPEPEPVPGADQTGDGAAGADAPEAGDASGPEADDPLDALRVRNLHRLDLRVVGSGADSVIAVRPEEAWAVPSDAAYRAPADAPFSLADLYSIEGLYRDTNRDLVADDSRARLSVGARGVTPGVVDLATRIGLETGGLRLPLARVAGQDDDPSVEGFPILIGPGHYATSVLGAEGLIEGYAPEPGAGYVLLVDDAFGDPGDDDKRGGLVVDGADTDGVGAALDWLARRSPWLWEAGKGEARLADLQTDIRRFLQAREAPGQVALALAKVDTWMDRIAAANDTPSRVEIELVAKEVPPGTAAVFEDAVRARLPSARVDVESWSSGYGVGDTIFVQDWELPWEVATARSRLESQVYPNVRRGEAARIELRLSEPPEVRSQLEDEIRSALADAGADPIDVRVLSAYKQGYSWIDDVVLPRLRDLEVADIDITYHTLDESEEVRWQTIAADTRWLQELYPVDAVLARELSIPDSLIRFTPTRTGDPTYTLTARNGAGEVVHRDTFSPRYVVRPFFDLFPDYEQVRVTTGWLSAEIGTSVVIDERIVTDPELFWDRLQTETFGEIVDYVLDTQRGDPSAANAPFFDEFRIDLRMSEPNHRIGIDEEVISSLEALHEDIYFETLTLFDLIGSRYQTSQPYPGRVLPWIDPTGAGEAATARLTLTGKERAGAELVMRTYATADDTDPVVRRYPLGPVAIDAPRIVGAAVQAGEAGLRVLQARVEVPDSVDRYAEFAARSSEVGIDRQFMNADLVERMVDALDRLHAAGLFSEALSWDRVAEVVIEVRVADAPHATRALALARTPAPASTVAPRLLADGWRPDGAPLVQWDTPIPPAESDSILARLATFDEADVYYMTDSFLGQPVWAMDLLPSRQGRYRSQAKLNALKPTLFISGRQHANEVSSTSHILRLAELLVTDSSYTALLDKVNVVLHPITNPDGARLAVEMQETNPDFMLHAGYLGALGVDATSGERDDDPIYPESQVRRRIRETWLPDIYINMHGYPSHEWVQYFAGYSAWVRGRQGGQRSWWAPRGWFIPGLSIVEDDDEPDYGTAQWAVLDSVAAAITGQADVEEMNRRFYERYRKYGSEDREAFTEFFHNGILVNLRLRGPETIGTGLYSPRITWFSTTTEAPDETARGDWLDLVASAGLAHSTALLRYLATGEFEVVREADADAGGVTRKVYRLKPVLPP